MFGKSIQKQISQLNQQAIQLAKQSRNKEAANLMSKASKLIRRVSGENHPTYIQILNNLATVHLTMGDYDKAISISKQAMNISRKVLKEKHPEFINSLGIQARICLAVGKHAEAESILKRAIEIQRKIPDKNRPNFPHNLNSLVLLYISMGKYSEAEPICKQVIEIRRKKLGEKHPDFAASLNNLAEIYGRLGRYAAAEPLCRQAVDITRKAVGEDHLSFSACLNNLGKLYRAMGKYAEAEPLYRQAAKIARKTLGENHPAFATCLSNLALLLKLMGKYSEAESLCREALEIKGKTLGEDHPSIAISLDNLAHLHEFMGNYTAAEPLYQQALEINRKALGEDHPVVAHSKNSLAVLYLSMNNYTAAEQLMKEIIEIERRTIGEDHPDFGTSLSNLADVYKSKGKDVEAEQLCQQAVEIKRKALGDGHPELAIYLNKLASLYISMFNYAAAEPILRKAREIIRKSLGDQHLEFANCLNLQAALHRETAAYANAVMLYQQVLEIQRKALGDEHTEFAITLDNLAVSYSLMGDAKTAVPLVRQALEIFRKNLGEEHKDFGVCLHNLAAAYIGTGDYAAAEPLYQQLLEIYRKTFGEHHVEFAKALGALAGLRAATGNEDEALSLMKQAAAIDDEIMWQVFSYGSEKQRMTYIHKIKSHLDAFLSLVFQHLSTSPGPVRDALDLVLRRKAIGAEALAAQRDAVLGGVYPELEPKLQELTALRRQMAQKTLAGPGTEGMVGHKELLAEWEANKTQLEVELARQIPEMNLEEKLRTTDRKAVASLLPEGTALVEFVQFNVFDFLAVEAQGELRWKPARYLAFVLPAGEPDDVRMVDLGEAKQIDKLIVEFRSFLIGGNGTSRDLGDLPEQGAQSQSDGAGTKLREVIFDKISPVLGDCKRLLLAPDGDLTRLPFEVLPVADGRYLIDNYKISYLSTGRDVLRFGALSSRQPAIPIIIADPDFDLGQQKSRKKAATPTPTRRQSRELNRANLQFGRLPGTRGEGEQISRMLSVEPWLEDEALEAKLKACKSPHILHLATHGFFLEDQKFDPNKEMRDLGAIGPESSGSHGRLAGSKLENPLLRSGLALAGVNTWLKDGNPPPEAEDGILTAEDVSGLDLLNTELVVLSACETGLGEIHVGEGVFGLQRAFVLAGARTLVMSLWKVPDLATAILMERFYDNLLNLGLTRDESLRNAQNYVRDVTIGQIKDHWLTPEMIKQLSAGDSKIRQAMQNLARQPDDQRPFIHPLYWGAFICQGDPGKVSPLEA